MVHVGPVLGDALLQLGPAAPPAELHRRVPHQLGPNKIKHNKRLNRSVAEHVSVVGTRHCLLF